MGCTFLLGFCGLWVVALYVGTSRPPTRYVGTAPANCLLALGGAVGTPSSLIAVGWWRLHLRWNMAGGVGWALGAREGGTQAPGGSALIGQGRPIPRRSLAPQTMWRPRYLPFLCFLSLGPAVRCAAHCHCQLGTLRSLLGKGLGSLTLTRTPTWGRRVGTYAP